MLVCALFAVVLTASRALVSALLLIVVCSELSNDVNVTAPLRLILLASMLTDSAV